VPQRSGTAEVPNIEHLRNPSDGQPQRSQDPRDPLIYLIAPMLAANAPFAEVLTVIGQQVVIVFTCPGTCPMNDFIAIEPRGLLEPDPDWVTLGELRQNNLLHRTAAQAARQTCVLHDLAATHVDTVMGIATTWCNDVRTTGGSSPVSRSLSRGSANARARADGPPLRVRAEAGVLLQAGRIGAQRYPMPAVGTGWPAASHQPIRNGAPARARFHPAAASTVPPIARRCADAAGLCAPEPVRGLASFA
jgi:hypothetical protein